MATPHNTDFTEQYCADLQIAVENSRACRSRVH
jgi:hypothetical protein